MYEKASITTFKVGMEASFIPTIPMLINGKLETIDAAIRSFQTIL
jgi:hypothetical protein